MDPLHRALLDSDRHFGLFRPDETILVGCSGGADSLALAHALQAIAAERSWQVAAAYVHHGLRPEADQEAETLRAQMAAWGMPFRVIPVDVAAEARRSGRSPEEAARDARYAALNVAAAELGATVLALGHHADDQIETVLWRLTKGSALPGLLGIPMIRTQAHGPRIVRPLLTVPRAEIEVYLRRRGLAWFEDATNQDVTIPRNRLRHQVVPVLKDLNPALPETLASTLEVLSAEHAWLNTATQEAFRPLVRHEEPGLLAWEEAGFQTLPLALQRRAMALAYEAVTGSRRGLTFERIERMRAADMRALDLGEGLRLVSEHGTRWLSLPYEAPDPVPAEPGLVVEAWQVVMEVATPEEAGPLGPEAAAFDADALKGDLEWRTARPRTDRFTPWGHQHAHSLERFLAKEHIPTPLRERLVVLAIGEEVLWIVGLRRSRLAPIREGTRWALIARHDRQTWFDRGISDPYHG